MPVVHVPEALKRQRKELHEDGWTNLPGGMPEWELCRFVERLHRRYNARIVEMLEEWRADWMHSDEEGSGPGSDRPGGLVARWVNKRLEGSGVFVYPAHPSQDEAAEGEYDYSGPRFYVTCSEAVMKRYKGCGVAPPPPAELQTILWPNEADRRRPWLTEIGWTLVPEDSQPQVMHADICSDSEKHAREPGLGRYHHFAWKLTPEEFCTTNVVPGGFSEGYATWDDYDKWTVVRANAVIFDSEMLHRGGRTKPGAGWTCTLTLQVCSGTGWVPLRERVSTNLMWYTHPLGWQPGDAVDAMVAGLWKPALVRSRSNLGLYGVTLDTGELLEGLTDADLRYRQGPNGATASIGGDLRPGAMVEACFDGAWLEAKVARVNGDGTCRVIWKADRSFTDALPAASLRLASVHPSGEAGTPAARSAQDSPGPTQKSGGLGTPTPARKRSRSPASTEPRTRKSSKVAACATPAEMRRELLTRGFVELPHGMPEAWNWQLFDFVESCFDRFSDLVVRELDSLREFWEPCAGSSQRPGAFAAMKASERLKPFGVAVYSPGPSENQDPPYNISGPRWYISITPLALEVFGEEAPLPPPELLEVLVGHPADSGQALRARGLGWTLAPAGSDPQALHADIWGTGAHTRAGHTRWPHLLWKRRRAENCTTEIVPGAFTEGAFWGSHFSEIRRAQAPMILVDSEALHRGAATLPAPPGDFGGGPSRHFTSTLSLELCTASGWAAWEAYATGGTTKDPTSKLDWRMLLIGGASGGKAAWKPKEEAAQLPEAPWASARGEAALRAEQREWEFAS